MPASVPPRDYYHNPTIPHLRYWQIVLQCWYYRATINPIARPHTEVHTMSTLAEGRPVFTPARILPPWRSARRPAVLLAGSHRGPFGAASRVRKRSRPT